MHKKLYKALEMLNLLSQTIYVLLLPVGIGALISFVLTKYLSCPSFIWAILITLGVLIGLYSMVKYILSATENIKKVEMQQEKRRQEQEEKESRQAELRDAGKDLD